jgi:hypothetical protein
MKKFYLLVFLFISIVSTGISQKSLSDYSYVIVPEVYNFLKEKDEYQLNSLTKFLFNKYGFHAYFDRETPVNVQRCDGLWADVIGSPGFVYTRIEVVLRDCYGAEVYKSNEGKSKEKNFKKAYFEAMRRSFESIEVLGVQQREIDDTSTYVKTENKATNNESNSIKNSLDNTNIKNLPSSKYTTYSHLNEVFLLKKTKTDYKFYKESSNENEDLLYLGKLVYSQDELQYIDVEKNTYKVYFEESKDLIMETGNENKVYKFEN